MLRVGALVTYTVSEESYQASEVFSVAG